ncbi:MAG: tetratricopeptide repeat protein [Candidatus Cloacimonadota bacterium]|nr:MAG: tetratricopeptide repeat protein [Candidatus Cloacimonadota bacterium]
MRKFAVCIFILFFMSCQNKRSSVDLFTEGEKLFKQHKYDEAIAKYEEGLKLSPNSAVGHNLVGMAYRFKYNALKDPSLREKEIAAFNKAIEVDSTFWIAYINLGATYYYNISKEKAIPYFEKALVLNPANPEREELEKMIEEGKAKGKEQ